MRTKAKLAPRAIAFTSIQKSGLVHTIHYGVVDLCANRLPLAGKEAITSSGRHTTRRASCGWLLLDFYKEQFTVLGFYVLPRKFNNLILIDTEWTGDVTFDVG
jgi:hypothetical protein